MTVAKGLGCKLFPITPVTVIIVDGQEVRCAYMCQQFAWEMQGQGFVSDFLVMPLGGCEMVLGIQWLSTLGDILWNFKQLKMSFTLNGIAYQLQGANSTSIKLITDIQ